VGKAYPGYDGADRPLSRPYCDGHDFH
jgi:hypothetical protein